MLLERKTAIIYGAGGGIGSAVSRVFAKEGANVFLAGRTHAKVSALVDEICATGAVAEAAEVDALDADAVERHAQAVFDKAGRIDVLFNAVGMDDVQGRQLSEMSLDEFMQPISKAARTQFNTTTAVARHMAVAGSGVILTLTAGPPDATPFVGGFGAACGTIENMWRTLAAELAPSGVRLVGLRSAGSPDTPDVEETFKLHAKATGVTFEECLAEFSRGTLLQRLPSSTEIADVAAFMASDRASALTGTFINVTCGSKTD